MQRTLSQIQIDYRNLQNVFRVAKDTNCPEIKAFAYAMGVTFFYNVGQPDFACELEKRALSFIPKSHYYYENLVQKFKSLQDPTYKQNNSLPKNSFKSPSNLRGLWIFRGNGIFLYSYNPLELSIDPDLLGGFISAIQSFCLQLNKKKLSAILIENEKYYLEESEKNIDSKIEDDSLVIVGLFDKKTHETKIHTFLHEVLALFRNQFRHQIRTCTNHEIFSQFSLHSHELPSYGDI